MLLPGEVEQDLCMSMPSYTPSMTWPPAPGIKPQPTIRSALQQMEEVLMGNSSVSKFPGFYPLSFTEAGKTENLSYLIGCHSWLPLFLTRVYLFKLRVQLWIYMETILVSWYVMLEDSAAWGLCTRKYRQFLIAFSVSWPYPLLLFFLWSYRHFCIS